MLLALLFVGPACTSKVAPEHAKVLQLRKHHNILQGAVYTYRIDNKEAYSNQAPRLTRNSKASFETLCRFSVSAGAKPEAVSLQLDLPDFGIVSARLNGAAVPFPVADMHYQELVILSPSLKPGTNELELTLYANPVDNEQPRLAGRLFMVPLSMADLKFTCCPVLGAADETYFSVTCETNLPSQISISSSRHNKTLAISPTGLLHRIKVARDTDNNDYLLTVSNGPATIKYPLSLPPPPTADKLTFVMAGDTQGEGANWARTVAAFLPHHPQLVVRTGDFVSLGCKRWQWDADLLEPTADLLANVPLYTVRGNHDWGATIFQRLFYRPGPDSQAPHWSQRIGPALLIGVDGQQKFATGSENYKWLESVLKDGSDAKFIFLFSHFPAICSGERTRLRPNGRVPEETSQNAYEFIMPLLEKYHATAYISGHCHFYERMERPSGLTLLVSGGGGAYLQKKTWNAPYSKVYNAIRHYSLFQIDGDTCTLRAITPKGQEIDKRVWQARKPQDR